MRWALALLLMSTSALASRADRLSVSPRLDRRDRLGGAASPILLSLSLLPPDSECSGTPPDGVTFTRASAATCISADGQTATLLSANEARVHSTLGLLVEGSATNVLLHSRDVTAAPWEVSSPCSLTGTGMDGSSVARCSGDAVQEISPAAGTRTASVFVRQASAGTCKAAIEVGGIGYSDIDLDGSWQRLTVTYTADGSSVFVVVASIGDGCTIDIDFVQDEAGSLATSPIVTAGTAAVRADDEVSYVFASTSFAESGCAAFDFASLRDGIGGGAGTAGFLYGGASIGGRTIIYGYSSTHLRGLANGLVSQPIVAANAINGVAKRYGAAWGDGEFSLFNYSDGLNSTLSGFLPFHSALNGGLSSVRLYGHLRDLVIGRTPEACQ